MPDTYRALLNIVKGGFRLQDLEDRSEQPRLWVDTVRLSDDFFQALRDHPVPVNETALRQIANNGSVQALARIRIRHRSNREIAESNTPASSAPRRVGINRCRLRSAVGAPAVIIDGGGTKTLGFDQDRVSLSSYPAKSSGGKCPPKSR
ncbi:replication protein RepA [Azospirillum sp. A1-3]|uniref:replication protein RepA n=1 Tax=Azospirillum sp. A1-3 TaxID=185874 RepID=UPI0020773789|nr:replication protein RepA [Azospirillum sp. A1-3]MCM8738568.1 replication protein RepA [Azospirillum sp. A1-3]